ncbi:PKD domain-containing protein [Methanolobus sediminis]|uniref:PKD domain-containing protein n=1 Tax=Methanolobus sediminis TaxID=3072978 RepID=A0AA51UKW5_9EURY|nr:PKD domain-containing protein [Methanolobus sediminis]WMW25157.1 PKD domain-containing protein [Methanolobus sediminis]
MRKHIIILLFVAILLAFTSIVSAADITVGQWETYTVSTDLTINPGEVLDIQYSGELVILPGVTLTNNGLIDNDFQIHNYGTIANFATITNFGTITNSGTITNYGTIDTFGTIDTSGTISNFGTINRYLGSTIDDFISVLLGLFTGNPINWAPISDANGPYTGVAGTAITLDGTGSSDSDGTIVSYEWDFGDGSPSLPAPAPYLSHAYASAGTYTVTLTVTDDDGATVADTSTVEIAAADYDGSIPEFPTIALPMAAIIGLAFIFRKRE